MIISNEVEEDESDLLINYGYIVIEGWIPVRVINKTSTVHLNSGTDLICL